MKSDLRERRAETGSRLSLVLVSSGLALAGAAQAQTPPPSRDQVLLVAEEPLPIPDHPETTCTLPSAAPAEPGAPQIAAIEVVGAPAFATSLKAEAAQFTGHAADAAGLAAVAERIDCLYRAAGYAFVKSRLEPEAGPDADPQHLRFRLIVDEGRLGRIEAQGGSAAEREFAMRAFSGVPLGRPVRFADINHALAQAHYYNVWGIEPQASRDPHDPDHVVLTLKLPKSRPQVYVSIQNASRASVGHWSASGSVTYHLPTPFYDEASVALFTGLHDLRQVGGEVSDSVLLGKGFGLRAAASVFQERPSEAAPFKPYVGATELALIEATQLLPSIGDELIRWRAGLEADRQTVKQKAGRTTERDDLRIAYASVRIDGHAGTVLGWGQITVRQGLDGGGASRPGGLQLSRPDADPQASDLRFSGRLERPFKGGRQVSLDLRGQWTDKPLLLFEQFTYGGLSGGRGLDPDALMGDRGLSGRLEYDDLPIRLGEGMTVTPLGYLDAAWVRNLAPGGPASGRALFGGVGGRLSWSQKVNLDLAYTHPLEEVRGVAPALSGPRMVLTLSAGF